MEEKETSVRLKCSCGCSAVVVEKSEWDNGEIDYVISIQDSRYDHNYTTFWGRIKSAAKILFGKPIYYSDVYIDKPEIYKKFVNDISALCVDKENPADVLRQHESDTTPGRGFDPGSKIWRVST